MSRAWSEYEGLKVVVTGAASGMGAATTKLLVEGGAKVYALDVRPVEQEGITEGIECNLLDQSSIDAAIEKIGDGIAAIFSCAGLPTSFGDEDTVTVNFFAARYLIEQLLPKMNKGGAVAVISSLTLGWEQQIGFIYQALQINSIAEGRSWVEANKGNEQFPGGYPFSKYCLAAWTTFEAPAIMEQYGVRLNALGPGMTTSPMLKTFQETSGEHMNDLPNPMGRFSEPVEQAQAMMFLNSPLASYLVGANIPNDGGLEAALKGGHMKGMLQGGAGA